MNNAVFFVLNEIITSSLSIKWTKCKRQSLKTCKGDKCKAIKHSNLCSHVFTQLSSKAERITNA